MTKIAVILINFIGLFFLHLFSDLEVNVQNKVPTTLTPGEKKEVKIIVEKGDIQGFAKLELVLPPGFIATPGETKGASFTFASQKARFVWMTMPTEATFEVTYYIQCDETTIGKHQITGTYSYIKDNQRMDFAIQTEEVIVQKVSEPVAETTDSNPTGNQTTAETAPTETTQATSNTNSTSTATENVAPIESTTTTANTTSETTEPVATTAQESVKSISGKRTYTKISDTEYRVDVAVSRSEINGFVKVVETLPPNCKAEKIQDASAVVTTDKSMIKFVWFEVPNSPLIQVAYRVTSLSTFTQEPNISGKISYVESNKPMEAVIYNDATGAVAQAPTEVKSSTSNNVANSTASSNNTSVKQENSATAAVNTNEKTSVKSEKTASNREKTAEKNNTAKSSERAVTSTPEPEVGVTYKVQILAAHRVVNKTYFRSTHGYAEGFNIENHEGWVKYTTGKYNEYKAARDERERLKTDYGTLPGPFVTAYNNGERITVQEALLITKQQWYP